MKIEEMDDYQKAGRYLIKQALTTGDGFMLRAVKTLMDEVSTLKTIAFQDNDLGIQLGYRGRKCKSRS